ncbi:MAG: nucleotidyltransferase domain-containing protein [bacterium]
MRKKIISLKYLNKKEQDGIKKLTTQLTTNMKDNLVILELFGSKIRGDFEKDSDIDMLVVLKKEICQSREKIFDILFKIDPYYELKISPIIYSEAEYKKNEKLESPFIENIMKEGIVLWSQK